VKLITVSKDHAYDQAVNSRLLVRRQKMHGFQTSSVLRRVKYTADRPSVDSCHTQAYNEKLVKHLDTHLASLLDIL